MTNKDIVLAYVAAFNGGDIDRMCELFSDDALSWGALEGGSIDKVRLLWQELSECLQMQLQVDAIIVEGNVVAVRYTERGKSVGAFRGLGPTGRTYEMMAMGWFELKDGRIHRRWGVRDTANRNRQLGFPSA